MTTLRAAYEEAVQSRWSGTRSASRTQCQATIAMRSLELRGISTVEAASKEELRAVVKEWLASGLSAATCRLRLNCLSVMGVQVAGTRPKLPRALKWWLDPHNEAKIVASLMAKHRPREMRVAYFILWTTRTGLRIEESLRLTWGDVRKGPRYSTITAPGSKTATAQATLVLTGAAVEVLESLGWGAPSERVFNLAYWEVQRIWLRHRKVFGLEDPKVATLKALRRSAARFLHGIRGMPLDLVRQYLRHESVNTTMGYLRLTGGYNEEEMAKWL